MLRYAWIVLMAVGCKYPDPGVSGDDQPSPTTDVIVRTTTSGDTDVFLLPGVDVGPLDDFSPVQTFDGAARVFTLAGFIFVATTDGKLLKFSTDGFGRLMDTDTTLDFTPHGITAFADSFVVIDTKVWYFDPDIDKAFFIDPETMEILHTISITSAHPTGRRMVITGAAERDDDLYVSLYLENTSDPLIPEQSLSVMRIDTTNYTVSSIINDPRCIHAQMIGVAPNGTVLIIGDSSYLHEFGTPLAPTNCFARITSSAPADIDPDGFFRQIDEFMDGDVSGSYSGIRTADTAFFWAREDVMFSSLSQYEAMSRWTPHLVSIDSVDTHTLIDSNVVNIGAPGRTFHINDDVYFAVNKRNDSMSGGAIRGGTMEAGFDEIAFYTGQVVLVARVE